VAGVNGSWDSFALLLIDVQQDFMTQEMALAFPAYESNVTALLDLCRRENMDIVHLRASFQPDRSDWMAKYHFLGRIPCVDGTPGAALLDCAVEQPGETVIVKHSFDGFMNPCLQQYLDDRNKRYLLVAGLVTSVCVLLTAATAAQKGYLVAVVEDCCADKPEAHWHTLDRYPFIFDRTTPGQIVSSREQWLANLARIGER